MATDLALERSDKEPIGAFDDVQSIIRDVFPAVQFGWTQSGQEKLEIAAQRGVKLPPVIRKSLETLPALLEGRCDGHESLVEFGLGYEEPVKCLYVNEMGGQTYIQEAYGHAPRTISWWEEQTEKWFGEKVETVYLMRTYVSDLTPLAELSRLESVYLGPNDVTDLSPLAGLENLDTISLTWGAVSDLSPLSKLTSLEVLELDQTQVSDLSPLAKLRDLRILYLAQTHVSDISPLMELTKLEELRLNRAPVSDLSSLIKLKNLRILALYATSVSDLSPLAKPFQRRASNLHYGNHSQRSSSRLCDARHPASGKVVRTVTLGNPGATRTVRGAEVL